MCLTFSAKVYVILQALRWSRRHKQVCHFSSLFYSQLLALLLLQFPFFHVSFYFTLSGTSGGTILSLLLLFYLAIMGPQSLIYSDNYMVDELVKWNAPLHSSTIQRSFSPLTSCIHSFFLSVCIHSFLFSN